MSGTILGGIVLGALGGLLVVALGYAEQVALAIIVAACCLYVFALLVLALILPHAMGL